MMPPSGTTYQGAPAYSAEAQALYRARAQQQGSAQARPYLAQTQPGGGLPPSYVSLSQAPYNVQTHTPYIAPSQVPYVAPSQNMYKPPPQSTYGSSSQAPYSTAAVAAQARYATATGRYAAAAPQLSQVRPQPRPPLSVEHFSFGKLAPQPKNAIDIISEDAVLPSFPLKKKAPKKRKLAGFEVFAAEVAKHKRLVLESRGNGLHCLFGKTSPIGRPPKVPPSDLQALAVYRSDWKRGKQSRTCPSKDKAASHMNKSSVPEVCVCGVFTHSSKLRLPDVANAVAVTSNLPMSLVCFDSLQVPA